MEKKKQKDKPVKPEKQVEKPKEASKPINDPWEGYERRKMYPTSVTDTRVRKPGFMDSKDMLKKTGKVGTIHDKRVKVIHPKKGK